MVEQIKKLVAIKFIGYWPNDWVLRLLALLFAVFLWYFVVGEDKVDTHILIPVELVNLPRDLVVTNQFKQQLEVTISGPRGLVDGLRRRHISRSINLSEAQPGITTIRNDPKSIPFPRGIKVLRIHPAHITLLIDRLKEKSLPIQADISGQPAVGYELIDLQLEPAAINISGPEVKISGIELLRTIPIDISNLNASVVRRVPLLLDQELLELLGEVTVNVTIIIREKNR